jgi:NADPH:quinone reductase-like Zn-dependent oxidoreductase
MKAVIHYRHGSPDVLRLEDVPPPRLGRADDVLVKVHATSINSWDWDLQRGAHCLRLVKAHRRELEAPAGGEARGGAAVGVAGGQAPGPPRRGQCRA